MYICEQSPVQELTSSPECIGKLLSNEEANCQTADFGIQRSINIETRNEITITQKMCTDRRTTTYAIIIATLLLTSATLKASKRKKKHQLGHQGR